MAVGLLDAEDGKGGGGPHPPGRGLLVAVLLDGAAGDVAVLLDGAAGDCLNGGERAAWGRLDGDEGEANATDLEAEGIPRGLLLGRAEAAGGEGETEALPKGLEDIALACCTGGLRGASDGCLAVGRWGLCGDRVALPLMRGLGDESGLKVGLLEIEVRGCEPDGLERD